MIPTLRKTDQGPRWRRAGRRTLDVGQDVSDRARATAAEGLVRAGKAVEPDGGRRPWRLLLVPVIAVAVALAAGIARKRAASSSDDAPAEDAAEAAKNPSPASAASNGAATAKAGKA